MNNNNSPENGGGISRRKFLAGTGAVAGGLALAGGLGGLTLGERAGLQLASAQPLMTDLDILNFALTLEHFENAAYRAANATGILKGTASELFKAFGDHENTHVMAITDTIKKLGGPPVAEQASYNLPKLENESQIVNLFIVLEEVGAGAYLGAAPLIKDKGILAAAISIHNVEAEHASALKSFQNDPMPSPAFGKPSTVDEVRAAVAPFLQAPPPPPGGVYTIENPAPSLSVAVNRVGPVNAPNVTYFAETGHTLSGAFRDYWNKSGGLAIFGFPISEPYRGVNRTDGKMYVQQFFQRNRFEFHPENKGTPFEVLLGLLGSEQLFKDMMGGAAK